MNTTRDTKLSWVLVLSWIVLTTAAFQLGLILSGSGSYEWFLLGALIGIAQGLVFLLWRKVSIAIWWAAATFIGWIAALTLVLGIGVVLSRVGITGTESGSVSGLIIAAFACGPVLGGTQWLILRRLVGHAAWWILATSVGFTTAIFVAVITAFTTLGLYSPHIGWIMGIIYGAITGVALKLLLGQTGLPRKSGQEA